MACHFSEPVKCPGPNIHEGADGGQCLNEGLDTGGRPMQRPIGYVALPKVEVSVAEPLCYLPPGEPSKVPPGMTDAVMKSDGAFEHVMESHPFAMKTVTLSADEDQRKNTELLGLRAREVDTYRSELQNLVCLLTEEITLLEEQKRRLLRALKALQMPEATVSECMRRRSFRTGYDLVHDSLDTELSQGDKLCRDIRDVLTLVLKEVNSQLESNKTCKAQLEFDWSDKTEDYRIETVNVGLRNDGPVRFYPGAARLPANQSTSEHWLHYVQELIKVARQMLNKSSNLRQHINEEIMRASDDLQKKADEITVACERMIAATTHDLQEIEKNLNRVLSEISIAETIHEKLVRLARQVDFNLKTAQTRLNNRHERPRAENTRDVAHFSLLEEVKHLNEDAARLQKEMIEAEETIRALYNSRAQLEDAINVKRKSLYVDQKRCLPCWIKFPDSATLSGFNVL